MFANGRPLDEVLYRNRWAKLPQILLWVLLAVILVKTAWIGDDAYITFRCVENAVTGHGLGFNAGERVQAYTHPLWMLLLLPFQALWHEPYWTSLALSFLLTLWALVQLGRHWKMSIGWLVLPLLAISSKAFTEYASSGLENALTYSLLAAFLVRWLGGGDTRRHLFWLSLVAGGMILNRMDTILLVGPALGMTFWQQRPRSLRDLGAVWQVVLGLLPVLVWEIFSILYYGFPFPNTAYAKLGAGIPSADLWRMGFAYFTDSLARDPVTLPMIGLGIVVACFQRKWFPLALGLVLYMVYIRRIGGDFMSGRFFAAPFLMALAIVGQWLCSRPKLWLMLAPAATLAGLLGPTPMLLSGKDFGNGMQFWNESGIADERVAYYHGTGLLHAFDGRDMPDHGWVQLGKDIATWEQDVVIIGSIGMTGYHAGPDKYIADVYGLADPLFARMPALYKPGNRPGHYSRAILQNYDESLRLKENFIVDPAAHDWLQKMWRITRAPLFSMKRLLLIWRLNLGIDKGQDLSHFRIPYNKDLSLPLADTSAIAMIHNMGVRFTFPAHQPGTKLGFTFRDGKALNVAWMKGKQPIGGEELTEHGSHALEIPNEADAVVLFPDNDWPHTWIANVVTF